MRLYLLGPMTGYDNENRLAFQTATQHLRHLGYEVISPDELDVISPVVNASWERLLARDLPFLLTCDGGAALPGWRSSRGASLEALVLSKLGRPIYEVPDPEDVTYTEDNLTLVSREKLPQIVYAQELGSTTEEHSLAST